MKKLQIAFLLLFLIIIQQSVAAQSQSEIELKISNAEILISEILEFLFHSDNAGKIVPNPDVPRPETYIPAPITNIFKLLIFESELRKLILIYIKLIVSLILINIKKSNKSELKFIIIA